MTSITPEMRQQIIKHGVALLVKDELENEDSFMPEMDVERLLDSLVDKLDVSLLIILHNSPDTLTSLVLTINLRYEADYDYPEHMARLGLPSSIYGSCDKRGDE